jgi:hypothetical protein
MNTFEQWWEEWKKSHALLIDGQSIEAMEILAIDAQIYMARMCLSIVIKEMEEFVILKKEE